MFTGAPVGLGDGLNEANNQAIVVWLRNNSGASINANEIVIVDPAGIGWITRTTFQGHQSAAGVTLDLIPNGSVGRVAVAGVAKVIAGPSGAAAGQHVVTDSVLGRAYGVATPTPGSSIGLWLQTTGPGASGLILLR